MTITRFYLAEILAQALVVFFLFALIAKQGVSAQTTCFPTDIDQDNDRLIEICDLESLNAIRNNLNGSGTPQQGCHPDGCMGFELTRSLDFMDDDSYINTANKVTYTVTTSTDVGWAPIGTSSTAFIATFNGNGHTISNLMINRGSTDEVGLFGYTDNGSEITNVGLLNVDITGQNNVGGLVGTNFSTMTSSYATGTISGNSQVGGLIGFNEGAIMRIYSTGTVSGNSQVGGLVGFNEGAVTNSYATGTVSGEDDIGGLVGWNRFGASVINSYATGGIGDDTFSLVANNNSFEVGGPSIIMNSYGIGSLPFPSAEEIRQTAEALKSPIKPGTIQSDVYYNWDADVWDFGTSNQFPILKYPDGNLIPGQGIGLRNLQVSTTNAELVPIFGGETTRYAITISRGTNSIDLALAAYNNTATIELVKEGEANDYFAGKGSRGSVSIPLTSTPVLIITVRETNLNSTFYRVVLTDLPPCTASLNIPDDNDGVDQPIDIDKDGNGLIEICDLEGLNAIRHQLDGTGYKANAGATVITTGCPSTCTGYELTRSLDFKTSSSYGSGNINTAWTLGDGWEPIGTSSAVFFSAIFNGNGYTISNLMINRSDTDKVGLFGYTGGNSTITAVGLSNVDISGQNRVGGLAGNNAGVITNSYASGTVSGTGSSVGGLAGENTTDATIKNSCATVTISGLVDGIGGLVGNNAGVITNSCASGTVSGSGNQIGGLVGLHQGDIENSYATGSVSGTGNQIGGLVGFNNQATITNCYAIGDVKGGDSSSNVGGLIGSTFLMSPIRNSYARGSVSGGGDHIGGLVGQLNTGGTISNSYWLSGSADSGGTNVAANASKTVMELISPTEPGIAQTDVYYNWITNDWDFGTSNQFPILKESGSDILTNLPACTLNVHGDDEDDVKHAMDIDKDGDGLIEICDLEGLYATRHQLNGLGYKTTENATVITTGCPSDGCIGYELTKSLDFMANNSYRPATNKVIWTEGEGWEPIGTSGAAFSTAFGGNGHTIANLMINRSETDNIGLFGSISETDNIGLFGSISREIANLGLLNVDITGQGNVGGLVGTNANTIRNSYATGDVKGSGSNVGGLVGFNNRGTITNNYATADVTESGSQVGGLVGLNDRGTITNSYATGDVEGSGSGIGNLAGRNTGGTIIRSNYATGDVAEASGFWGGLIGFNTQQFITTSYWLSGSLSRGGAGINANTSKTAAMLTSPTGAEGIYSTWSPNNWDFGTSNQFPALKYAEDCVDPPTVKSNASQPICETLLPHQGMNITDGLRESLRELNIMGVMTTSNQIFGVSTNNYTVTILLRAGTTERSIVLRLKAYNPDAEIQIFRGGDSTNYFAGKSSGDESLPIVVSQGTKLTIRVSEPDTDYTLTFDVEEIPGIQIRIKVFLEGPLQ